MRPILPCALDTVGPVAVDCDRAAEIVGPCHRPATSRRASSPRSMTSEIVRDLTDLVAHSLGRRDVSRSRAQRWCGERLAAARAGRRPLGDRHRGTSRHSPTSPAWRSSATRRSDASASSATPATTPALALYGHTDVVPPGDLDLWPGRDPFTLRIDERRPGLGTRDVRHEGRAGRRRSLPSLRCNAPKCPSSHDRSRCTASAARRTADSVRSRRCAVGIGADACLIAEPTAGDDHPGQRGLADFPARRRRSRHPRVDPHPRRERDREVRDRAPRAARARGPAQRRRTGRCSRTWICLAVVGRQ